MRQHHLWEIWLITYGIGDAVCEADEFYLSLRRFPLGEGGVDYRQGGGLGVVMGIGQRYANKVEGRIGPRGFGRHHAACEERCCVWACNQGRPRDDGNNTEGADMSVAVFGANGS